MIDAPAVNAQPARVLIVDDERHNRDLLAIMLAPEGLSVQTAGSGEEALAFVAEQSPDLILLDIMMPGMDGYEVVSQIKEGPTTRNIPVVMITALDDRNARLRGLSAGAEEFLTKPVDRGELCVRVRNLLRRKRAEEALGQMRDDQLRFKDEFLSHVSHELRSPLTAIKQFTSILLGGLAGDLNPEQREYQQIVLKNIHQLQAMIDDLLELTRIEAGKLTVVPASTSIATAVMDTFDTLHGVARTKGVTLAYDLQPDLPSAFADQTRLRQILIILLDNAIKFTPTGGAVRVRAQLLPNDPRFLLLEVSDTGCGITPEMSERIFERLYQASTPADASRKGLGLGLYICKELVRRQGGEISVRAQSHPGATVAFTVPVFSLGDVLTPLYRQGSWPADSVALVMIETAMTTAWPSAAARDLWSHEARSLLERCLLPDLDVLLPPVSFDTRHERFFIAAFADAAGASVLANRIRGQFDRLRQANHGGPEVSVSCRMQELRPAEECSSPGAAVTGVARLLEAAIASSPHPGGIQS
jgi:two-component system sensor histidine kinase/response regulator